MKDKNSSKKYEEKDQVKNQCEEKQDCPQKQSKKNKK